MSIKSLVLAAFCAASGIAFGRLTAPDATPAVTIVPEPTPVMAATSTKELDDVTIDPAPPPPVKEVAAVPCEPTETVKTAYVRENERQHKQRLAEELGSKPTREDEQTSPYRYLRYYVTRAYREYRAYRPYKKDPEEHGGEKDCLRRPFDLRCLGTVAHCTREPLSPPCVGTRVHCLKDKRDKVCQGTEEFCSVDPGHKSCVGTAHGCAHAPNRPECLGMLEFCTKHSQNDACFGTQWGCMSGQADPDVCSPDEK